jgi:hypothetical protein
MQADAITRVRYGLGVASVLGGRDHLWRFLPGADWKKLPDCFKAPNRGRRLTPRRNVRIECLQCGKEAKRHRRSACYCGDECRRRAQLERDALRRGKPLPAERVRGAARRNRALVEGMRRYGSVAAYLRAKDEQEQQRRSERAERSQKVVSPQEEWMNYHRSGLASQPKSEVIRYARVFRPQTAR